MHDNILKLYNKLYSSKKEGLCRGISLSWLEANILNQEKEFNERMLFLNKAAALSDIEFDALLNSFKQKGTSSEWVDALGFLDKVTLFQSPDNSNVFNSPYFVSQMQMELISSVASSDGIRAQGGLKSCLSQSLAYSPLELHRYLKKLHGTLKTLNLPIGHRLGFVVSSMNHATAIVYEVGVGWKFFDINQYPEDKFALDDTISLVIYLKEAFEGTVDSFLALNIEMVTTANNLVLSHLKESLSQFKDAHNVTKETCERKTLQGDQLLHIAAKNGHVDIVEDIAKYDPKLLETKNNNGLSVGHSAARYGYLDMVKTITKYNPKLHQEPDRDGELPIHHAALAGHQQIVEEFLNHDATLVDRHDKSGNTAAHYAAHKGYTNIIVRLIERCHLSAYGVRPPNKCKDLISQRNKIYMDSPRTFELEVINLAGFRGHKEIVRLLQQEQRKVFAIEETYLHIAKLEMHGIQLETNESSKEKGKQAVLLANELEKLVDQITETMNTSNINKNRNIDQLYQKFDRTLSDGYKQMGDHRAYWKPFLANIAIAATGIGLVFILYRWYTNQNMFFMSTERQNRVHAIGSSLKEFSPSPS